MLNLHSLMGWLNPLPLSTVFANTWTRLIVAFIELELDVNIGK